MSAVAGRRLAIRAFRTRSQHEVKAVGSRCVSRSACMFNLYNRVDVRRTAFSVDVSRCGAFSRQPVPVRSACTNNERGGEFVEKLEKAFRAAVNERKIKPELLEQMVVLIRDGAAQAETPNPDFNEELDKKMEAVGDLMLYVTGSMLLSVARDIGPKTFPLAVPFFRKAALMGHIGAKYSFARLLLDGLGLPKDAVEAANLFEEVIAESEDKTAEPRPQAVFTLGTMYFHGNGVECDTERALQLFEECSEAGLGQANHTLGMIYQKGDGVVADKVKAVECYRRGVEIEDARCMVELAGCYLTGDGVEKDESKALGMYESAAQKGSVHAMHSLGVTYWEGTGVEKNTTTAVEWWMKSAEMGNPRSCVNLSHLYLHGIVVEKDIDKAKMLLSIAASSGLPDAAGLLDQLNKRLKEDQDLTSPEEPESKSPS